MSQNNLYKIDPGLGQAQNCDRVKPFNGIPTVAHDHQKLNWTCIWSVPLSFVYEVK
jgi:hypothetical protein